MTIEAIEASRTATTPEDTAAWLNHGEEILVYDSWNKYREGDPHRQETFTVADPHGDFCYWCAFDGRTVALKAASPDGACIASVESALRLAGARSVYVTWQPGNHTPAVWSRWCSKWSGRTA